MALCSSQSALRFKVLVCCTVLAVAQKALLPSFKALLKAFKRFHNVSACYDKVSIS